MWQALTHNYMQEVQTGSSLPELQSLRRVMVDAHGCVKTWESMCKLSVWSEASIIVRWFAAWTPPPKLCFFWHCLWPRRAKLGRQPKLQISDRIWKAFVGLKRETVPAITGNAGTREETEHAIMAAAQRQDLTITAKAEQAHRPDAHDTGTTSKHLVCESQSW